MMRHFTIARWISLSWLIVTLCSTQHLASLNAYDPIQFMKEKTEELARTKGDPIQLIKNEIRKHQFAITHNPFKDNIAYTQFRQDQLSPEEQHWRAKRFHIVKQAQEKLLGISLADDEVLDIGFSMSGGGFRALLGTLGSLGAAQKTGLLDCVMSIAGLSGSVWFLAPWITSGLSLQDYKERILSLLPKLRNVFLHNPIGFWLNPKYKLTNTIDNLLVKFASNQPLTIVDLYGSVLSNTLFDIDNMGASSFYAHLASTLDPHVPSHAQRIEQVDRYPFPVYTAVLGDFDQPQEWFEFTPYEVGCKAFKAYVPSWGFGREFDGGKSIDSGPEQTLGYLMGICGSAFAANFETIYTEVLSKQLAHIPVLNQAIEYAAYSEFGQIRFAYAQVNNFMYNMPEFRLQKRKIIKLVDAGLAFNNPIFATYRKSPTGSAPDLVFVFDYGFPTVGLSELEKAAYYAKQKDLKFPVVNDQNADKKVLTVCKNEGDLQTPVILYLPRVKDNQLLTQYEKDERYQHYAKLLLPLDWENIVTTGYANTFSRLYTREQAETVCALAEFNMLTQIENIRKEMHQRIMEKREKNKIR